MSLIWIVAIGLVLFLVVTTLYVAAGCWVARSVSKRRPELFKIGDEYFILLAIVVAIFWPLWSLSILVARVMGTDKYGQTTATRESANQPSARE